LLRKNIIYIPSHRSYIELLRSDGNFSVGLDPGQELGDPGESGGPAGLAAEGGAEGDDADYGVLAVQLGDHQRAAGVAIAGARGAAGGVRADFGVVDGADVEPAALFVGDHRQVNEFEFRADSRGG